MQPSTLGPAAVRDLTLAPRPLSVVVLGAGKIGRVIAAMLAASGDYRVCLVDHDAHRLDGMPRQIAVRAGDQPSPAPARRCWPALMRCSMRCRSMPPSTWQKWRRGLACTTST
jgi:hypothetical protein